MGAYQVLSLKIRVDVGVMAKKETSTFSNASGLEPHL